MVVTEKVCIFVTRNQRCYKCKIMINRINLLLKAKNITARQFAEEIGIQPSGMSHIMSGRNNPSLDFVSKVIRRYPEIDANWLLLGKGEMYTSAAPLPSPTLFPEERPLEPEPELPYEEEPVVVEAPVAEAPAPLPLPDPEPADGRRLERILFFYSDNTFQEYRPAR